MKRMIIAGILSIVFLNAYSQTNTASARKSQDAEKNTTSNSAKAIETKDSKRNSEEALEDRTQVKTLIYKKDSQKQQPDQSIKNYNPGQTKRDEDSYLLQEEQ